MSIDRVFVIGAGLMGHGIAQVSAAAGKTVTLSDRTADLAEKGKARIAANLARQVEKGKLEQPAADETLGRIGTAEEFANLACFLASEQGSFITGTAINVDGGRSPVV